MPRKLTPNDEPLPDPSDNMDEARRAVLEKALSDITKRYGEGSIIRLGESRQLKVEAIPTGSLSLDIALGVGGIPRARVTEIFGPESSGKPPSACTSSLKPRSWVEPLLMWIWNMPSIPPMPPGWASMSMTCLSPSLIPANRLSRLSKPSFAPVRWMLSSLIPSPPSSPVPKSKGIW